MRFVYLTFGILVTAMFLVVAVSNFALLTMKSVTGFIVLGVVFFGGYFRLRKEQVTAESPEFRRRLLIYDKLVPIGSDAALAEEKMASVARLTKTENQLRLFTRAGSRRFRIAYFLGQEADARVVSCEGKVAALEVFPHER